MRLKVSKSPEHSNSHSTHQEARDHSSARTRVYEWRVLRDDRDALSNHQRAHTPLQDPATPVLLRYEKTKSITTTATTSTSVPAARLTPAATEFSVTSSSLSMPDFSISILAVDPHSSSSPPPAPPIVSESSSIPSFISSSVTVSLAPPRPSSSPSSSPPPPSLSSRLSSSSLPDISSHSRSPSPSPSPPPPSPPSPSPSLPSFAPSDNLTSTPTNSTKKTRKMKCVSLDNEKKTDTINIPGVQSQNLTPSCPNTPLMSTPVDTTFSLSLPFTRRPSLPQGPEPVGIAALIAECKNELAGRRSKLNTAVKWGTKGGVKSTLRRTWSVVRSGRFEGRQVPR